MSPWQVARQLQFLLATATWPGGAAEVVFGAGCVRVTIGPAAGPADAGLRLPFALVRVLGAAADAERPDLLEQQFEVMTVAGAPGDDVGERALLGSNRTGGAGSSRGRGLLEVEERVQAALLKALPASGLVLDVAGVSEVAAEAISGLGYVAARGLTVRARATAARDYAAPRRLSAAAPGGGAVTLAWTNPPARFDRHAGVAGAPTAAGGLVLRRAAGATAPASPTTGAGVTVGAFDVAVADAPGAGQVSYALFAGYDEDGDGVSDVFSPAATVTVTAA